MEYIEDFCEQLIILVHGKAILNGSLDEIKENYAKKNILIKGENIKVNDISKIKGVTSIEEKANEIVVHIENIEVAPKVFDSIKNTNISKYVVADAPLNEIFIHYVGGKNE
jgi:ABC-2 type transport system ATP-binding protein